MKAIFERQALLSGITLIQGLVSSNSTMPILANLIFEAKDGAVTIGGTDLEAFGRVTVRARVEEEGRITAPAHLSADLVRLLPEGDVSMETERDRLIVRAALNTYELSTLPADDFPNWPRFEARTTLTLRQGELRRALSNTLFAVPTRDIRKVLTGVLFDVAGGRLTCVATDGRKLGKTSITPVRTEGRAEWKAVVPARILEELKRNLGDQDEITVAIGERVCRFEMNDLVYLSTLIEGTYPNYEAVIPQSFKRLIKAHRTLLQDAVARAALMTETSLRVVQMKFSAGRLDLRTSSSGGVYEGAVEVEYDGEPFRIAFNCDYLQEVLKAADREELQIKIKDNTSPVVFEPIDDPDVMFLVMPVRLNDDEAAEDDASS